MRQTGRGARFVRQAGPAVNPHGPPPCRQGEQCRPLVYVRARVAVAALALGGLLVVAGPASVAVADTPTVVDSYTSGSFPFAVAVSPDGGTLYVANAGDDEVTAVDAATGATLWTVGVGMFPA